MDQEKNRFNKFYIMKRYKYAGLIKELNKHQYAVGASGEVYKTTDGGITWVEVKFSKE